MREPLLQVTSLNKRVAGVVASDQLSFEVGAVELHAVIGPNGAGKTTVLYLLVGLDGKNRSAWWPCFARSSGSSQSCL